MNPALLRTVDVAAVTREFRWAHTRNLLDAGSRQNGQPRQECVPVACAVQKLEHLLRQGDQGALQDSKTRQHGSLSPGQTDATCCNMLSRVGQTNATLACNMVAKHTQHVACNNVARCCTNMLSRALCCRLLYVHLHYAHNGSGPVDKLKGKNENLIRTKYACREMAATDLRKLRNPLSKLSGPFMNGSGPIVAVM